MTDSYESGGLCAHSGERGLLWLRAVHGAGLRRNAPLWVLGTFRSESRLPKLSVSFFPNVKECRSYVVGRLRRMFYNVDVEVNIF